jgi:flagellar basal-body rod modification protein FlgD
MTDPVTGASSVATSSASTSVDRPDQMGSDTFLKLLVAEMKYQDPSNPMSSADMMAQTATLTQTQSLQQIATQNSQLISLQRSLNAGVLVGHAVAYTDTSGTTQYGTVTSVRMDSPDDRLQAVIGGHPVDLGRITQVGPIAEVDATPAPSPTSTSAGTTTGNSTP